MREVRGTLPPNRCQELLLGSLSELRGAGTCHGAHSSNTKIPRPFSERAGGEEPPAFPQHSQQPQDPQAGRCPPSHHSGHSSCSGGSNPKAAFTKPHPHQAPKNSASSRHGMGTDRPHRGQFPPVGPHSSSPAPSRGLPKDPSPRAQPCTGAPNPGCVTKPPADTTDTPSPSP